MNVLIKASVILYNVRHTAVSLQKSPHLMEADVSGVAFSLLTSNEC